MSVDTLFKIAEISFFIISIVVAIIALRKPMLNNRIFVKFTFLSDPNHRRKSLAKRRKIDRFNFQKEDGFPSSLIISWSIPDTFS